MTPYNYEETIATHNYDKIKKHQRKLMFMFSALLAYLTSVQRAIAVNVVCVCICIIRSIIIIYEPPKAATAGSYAPGIIMVSCLDIGKGY